MSDKRILDNIILREFTVAIGYALTFLFLLSTSISGQGHLLIGKIVIKIFVIYTMYLSMKLFAKTFKKNVVLTLNIWKGFTFKIFFKAFGVLVLTLMGMTILKKIPFLNYGWTDLFWVKSNNIFISSMLEPQTTNIYPLVYAMVYFIIVLALIPDFVYFEEKVFRKGKLDFKSRMINSVKFGLVHCIVGVSIGTGLALVIPGYYFSKVYKKAYQKQLQDSTEKDESSKKKYHINATVQSATHHALYNTIIITMIILYLGYSIITSL